MSIPWFPAGSIFHARKSEQVGGQESPTSELSAVGVGRVIIVLVEIFRRAIRHLGRSGQSTGQSSSTARQPAISPSRSTASSITMQDATDSIGAARMIHSRIAFRSRSRLPHNATHSDVALRMDAIASVSGVNEEGEQGADARPSIAFLLLFMVLIFGGRHSPSVLRRKSFFGNSLHLLGFIECVFAV